MKIYNSLNFSWKAVGLESPEAFIVVFVDDDDSQKNVPQIGAPARNTPVFVVGASEKQKSLWRFAWKSWGLKLSFLESENETVNGLLDRYQELSNLFNSVHKETETDMNAWYAAKAAAREFSYGGSGDYHGPYSSSRG